MNKLNNIRDELISSTSIVNETSIFDKMNDKRASFSSFTFTTLDVLLFVKKLNVIVIT